MQNIFKPVAKYQLYVHPDKAHVPDLGWKWKDGLKSSFLNQIVFRHKTPDTFSLNLLFF